MSFTLVKDFLQHCPVATQFIGWKVIASTISQYDAKQTTNWWDFNKMAKITAPCYPGHESTPT